MEETLSSQALSPKSLQELAMEGHRHLEATVEAAHEILGSMNEVLCNSTLWVTAQPSQATASGNADSSVKIEDRGGAEGVSQQEAGWAALDEARLRYKSSTTALRAVISAIFSSPQMRQQDADSTSGVAEKIDPVELERLEQHLSQLKGEVRNKNQVLKLLIDQLRDLISDITMWQGC